MIACNVFAHFGFTENVECRALERLDDFFQCDERRVFGQRVTAVIPLMGSNDIRGPQTL